MTQLLEFGKTARSLARNPLGIIALFIVLLYAIAGLVLGVSATKLEASERLPLVWFIVIFPFAVLAVFSWLVSMHHKKLYAPSDFKSDDAFLQALSPEGQRQRLEKEVADLTPSTTKSLDDKEASKVAIGAEGRSVNRIRADVVLAEDLALRQLEAEFGAPIRRQVALKKDGERAELDGLLYHDGKLIAIDVKFISAATIRKNIQMRLSEISFLATKIAALGSASNTKLLVAIVSRDLDPDSSDLIKKEFDRVLKGAAILTELRFFDFGELQKRYGITSGV
jgi:hypothetical protein